MDFKKIGESIVKKAIQWGAEEAEAFLETNKDFEVTVRKGEIENLQKSVSQGLGLRVFIRKQMGFVYTSDLAEKSLEDTIRKAIELAKITEAKPWQGLPDSILQPLPDRDIFDAEISAVPDERKVAMARETEKIGLALDKRITNSYGGYYGDSVREVGLFNSKGIAHAFKETRCNFGVSLIAGEGDEMQGDGWRSAKRFFKELAPMEEVAKTAVSRTVEKLGPKPIPTGVVPVVFDRYAAPPVWMGILFALNGDAVFRKTTFMTDQLGKAIASPMVSISDDPTIPRFVSSYPCDGEGNVTRITPIVDSGVLKMFIYDSQTARKANVKVQTLASRGGYSSLPNANFLNIIVKNGEGTLDSLIKDLKEGFYVKGLRGLGTDVTTGSFSVGASGFWIKDGALAFPVDGVTLGGSTLEILKNVDRVAGDLDMRGNVNSPSFRVGSLTVGGKKN